MDIGNLIGSDFADTLIGNGGKSNCRRRLPPLDRQLGLAGRRLARFVNDVQAPGQCVAR